VNILGKCRECSGSRNIVGFQIKNGSAHEIRDNIGVFGGIWDFHHLNLFSRNIIMK
jgi:hypothetical protein